MGEVSTIGLDIAKNLFQIHGVDSEGTVVIRKRLVEGEFSSSLPICRLAALAWKRAQRRISGRAAIDAICADQGRRAAEHADAAPGAGSPDPSADSADQRTSRTPCRARVGGSEGA